MRPLPPLNALRAFEATARHRSVGLAARELCVTPSAVSHQVRILEEWFGSRLLARRGRSLELTAMGEAYLSTVSAALGQLARGTGELLARPRPDEQGPIAPRDAVRRPSVEPPGARSPERWEGRVKRQRKRR